MSALFDFQVAGSNLFQKVGSKLNKFDAELTATIIKYDQTFSAFGSFPVKMTIKYELRGKNMNFKKTISTNTDSKNGCTTIFMPPMRFAHDSHLGLFENT